MGLADLIYGAPSQTGINPDLTTTLSALLGPQTVPPMTGGSAPVATTPMSQLDQQIQDVISQRGQPAPVYQQPPLPTAPLWSKIVAAIGDAANVYARARNPNVAPSNVLGQMLANDQENRVIRASNAAKAEQARYEGRQTAAELKLRDLIARRGEKMASEAEAQKRASEAADRALKLQIEREAQAGETDRANQKLFQEAVQAEKNRKAEISIARIRAGIEGGSANAKEQEKRLLQAYAGINKINVPVMLAHGVSPDQILNMTEKSFVELGLDKDALDAARAYYGRTVGSELQDIQDRNLAAGSPAPTMESDFQKSLASQPGIVRAVFEGSNPATADEVLRARTRSSNRGR